MVRGRLPSELVAISVGLYTRTGSGINAHPYSRTGMLASDLPPEAIGRADIEPLLRRRRR